MQLTTALLSLFAAAASAAPAGVFGSDSDPVPKFGIMALRSASPIHFAQASASKTKLVLNLPADKNDAQCADGNAANGATFYIKDGELYLYGNDSPVQQFLVDRSGMGQGVLQYFNKTGADPSGPLELKGWEIDESGNLNFNGNGFIACPSTTDNSWNVWVFVGTDKPAGQEGCVGFTARTVPKADPVKCEYSTY